VPNSDKELVPIKLCTVRLTRDWQRADRVAPLPLELALSAHLSLTLTASRMNQLKNRGIGRQLAELNLLRSNTSNRCGIDDHDNASTNGLG
jgi:hypothetical protein